jgi:hypothetical protein
MPPLQHFHDVNAWREKKRLERPNTMSAPPSPLLAIRYPLPASRASNVSAARNMRMLAG